MAKPNFYKEWGESGTLSPTLVPDADSKLLLAELQADLHNQLAEYNPEIQKTDNLHATIIYLNPARLLELMRKHIDRKIKAERLYPHIMEALSLMLLFSNPSEVNVRVDGLGRLGEDGSILGAALNRDDFADASFHTRQSIRLTMQEFGMDETSAGLILHDEPRLEWAIGDSIPHISLLSGIKTMPLGLDCDLPETVVFDGVNIGKATKSPTEPRDLFWWHLRGLPGDPLRSADSPEYKK